MAIRKFFKYSALAVLMAMLSLALFGAGCAVSNTTIRTSFTFDGKTRAFEFLVPESYTGETPVPLLMVLHGKDQSVSDIQTVTGFDDIAEREGFIVVYPEAYEGAWNDGRVAPGQASYAEDVNDVGFLVEVASQVIANYAIDTDRLYLCGFSNGAIMTHRMAFEVADSFAAFGCVASAIPIDLPSLFTPVAPVNLCMMHGTADTTIPWEGGTPFPNLGTVLSVPDSVGYWIGHNGCSEDPTITQLPNRESNDRTVVNVYAYGPCDSGTEVVFYEIMNGGHTWPGSPASQALFTQGNISRDLDGAETLWAFFEDKTKLAR